MSYTIVEATPFIMLGIGFLVIIIVLIVNCCKKRTTTQTNEVRYINPIEDLKDHTTIQYNIRIV